MFNRKSKKDNDNIGPSKGLAKLMHKTAFLLLYPFRKPLAFLGLLVILFLAPTFRGVKPAEVHLWYARQFEKAWFSVSSVFNDKIKVVIPDFATEPNRPSLEPAIVPEVVDMPAKEARRKMFEKAKSSSSLVAIDIMQNQKVAPSGSKPQAATDSKTKKKLPLYYVNEPVVINGNAAIVNANEIKIGTESIFLYGIYVDPNTSKGIEGSEALQNLVAGKTVNCIVNAYTYQGVATGICTVDGVNINKVMVESGYSKNVALD